MPKTSSPPSDEIAVLVTTKHNGVFFGYLAAREQATQKTLTLRDSRNCLYWDESTKGFLGLAAAGPGPQCRVGAKVSSLTIQDVTAVAEASPEAVKRWEAGPWKT